MPHWFLMTLVTRWRLSWDSSSSVRPRARDNTLKRDPRYITLLMFKMLSFSHLFFPRKNCECFHCSLTSFRWLLRLFSIVNTNSLDQKREMTQLTIEWTTFPIFLSPCVLLHGRPDLLHDGLLGLEADLLLHLGQGDLAVAPGLGHDEGVGLVHVLLLRETREKERKVVCLLWSGENEERERPWEIDQTEFEFQNIICKIWKTLMYPRFS